MKKTLILMMILMLFCIANTWAGGQGEGKEELVKKPVTIWLDRDKAKVAIKIKNRLKSRGIDASVIITPNDPKEYSKGEILTWLKNK